MFASTLALGTSAILFGANYLGWNIAYYFLVPYMLGVLAEMDDPAEALGSLAPRFYYAGVRNGHGTAAAGGSGFRDAIDTNAGDDVGFVFVASDNVEGGL